MKSETSDERYERLSKSAPREATSPFSGSTPSAAEKQPHQPSSDLVYDPANPDTVVPRHSGQAVDRQEWTENGAAIMAGEERIAWVGDLLARRAIIAAHNAELAAERQRFSEQLLSALAAIEKFKAYLELYFLKGVLRFDDGHDYRQVARELIDVSPDLSLLHQHDAETRAQAKADVFRALNVTLDALNAPQDEWPCNRISKLAAEVRKPLVEALEQIERMPWPDSESPYARIARDALAKVKEKP